MATNIRFFVAGTPITQGNKTAIRVGNRAIVVEGKDKKARSNFDAWRHAVATEARKNDFIEDMVPLTGPVLVTLRFGLQRPASAPKKRRTWPVGARSGDVDKLARACLDAITGILIVDDSQVIGLCVTKDFGRPGVDVVISDASAPDVIWEPSWEAITEAVA